MRVSAGMVHARFLAALGMTSGFVFMGDESVARSQVDYCNEAWLNFTAQR